MSTKLDDSQISSQKLDTLVENLNHIKAPIDDETVLPAVAQDGERIYVKSLKKDYVYNASISAWEPYGAEEKVIIFMVLKPLLGVQKAEIQFPYSGTISEIYANAVIPGSSVTKIQVQKCSQTDYENVPNWDDVGSELEMEMNKKVVKQSLSAPVDVTLNDYFRIDIKELGQSLEGLTFNIKIKLN